MALLRKFRLRVRLSPFAPGVVQTIRVSDVCSSYAVEQRGGRIGPWTRVSPPATSSVIWGLIDTVSYFAGGRPCSQRQQDRRSAPWRWLCAALRRRRGRRRCCRLGHWERPDAGEGGARPHWHAHRFLGRATGRGAPQALRNACMHPPPLVTRADISANGTAAAVPTSSKEPRVPLNTRYLVGVFLRW